MEESQLHDIVKQAIKAGADQAEAVYASRRALSVGVRLDALEEVEGEEGRDLGLRVFVGAQQASVSGSDLSAAAVGKLVERVVAMARLAPADPYAGLADPALLARGPGLDLDLLDLAESNAAALEEAARAAEQACMATPGVSNSDGGHASWSASQWLMATSAGFSGRHASSSFSLYASAIAGEGAGMERAGEGRTTRHLADLPPAAEIGAEAGRRAVSRLNPRKLETITAPVIFENRVATSILSPLIGAISGAAVARGVSFLKEKLGEVVFAEAFDLIEDPHRVRGLGSAPFDDEGVETVGRRLIDKGVLTTWLMNTSSARQLGLASTGHASRGLAGPPGVSPTNLTVRPGTRDLAGLMADAGSGLLVTSLFGPSLNANTGDWSAGCAGFWFENGEIAYPVNEITVAGALPDLWARIVPGGDLDIRGSFDSPSLLIDSVAIAGR
ncbi:MAG: modulator protein [Caulobacteraceae bacterium]|nr:modulator protein [Caulobacteraceae bacterium]